MIGIGLGLVVLASAVLPFMMVRNILMLHRRIRSLDDQIDYIRSALAETAPRDPGR